MPSIATEGLVLLLVSWGLASSLIALLYYLRNKSTSRSMEEMTEASRRMQDGDYSDPQIEDIGSETGRLARAISRVASSTRQRLEDEQNEQRRLLNTIDNITDGVIVTNRHGIVTVINPAAKSLLGVRQAIGERFMDSVRDYELSKMIRECLANQQNCQSQRKLIEIGKPKHLVNVFVSPMIYGPAFHVLVVLQDTTELRRLETARQELVNNASHELRTPIAGLKAVVETLQDGAVDDPAAARRFLGMMETELDRLNRLVQDLLELSQLESGKTVFKMEEANLVELVQEPAKRARLQAERLGLQFVLDIPGSVPPVIVDRRRIAEVVDNLLQNALKHTPPGGRVSVAIHECDDAIEVAVEDTGVGIPVRALPHIFERFYKADLSRSDGGSGLGLAIAKHTIMAHNGTIWADSEEEKGSKFTFSLPKVDHTPHNKL